MKTLVLEIKKMKRTGSLAVLPLAGGLGAAYALVNFLIRRDALLSLPLAPMDVLLTQLYGMILLINLFAIIVAACMIYNLEFKGQAIKKLWMLPFSVPKLFLTKFILLTLGLAAAVILENTALGWIGMTMLPQGSFQLPVLVQFAVYSFVTSLPVLALMLLAASRIETMGVTLGIGVAGFLTGMALGTSGLKVLLIDPFIVMLHPAVAMSAQPELLVMIAALLETAVCAAAGFLAAKKRAYE